MNIQRFHAPTAREALALARAAFGDGTLILSNRQLADGVEVTAASESTLCALDAASETATRSSVTPAPSLTPAAAPAPVSAPARRAASTRDVVQADTEQLAMSTLSFQDYVRERMLRRQAEGRLLPETPEPAPAPALALAPEPAAHVMEAEAPERTTTLGRREVAAPASESAGGVMAELQLMKKMMEERFNVLAWLGQARQDPIHSNLMLKFVRAGYSPALARAVLEPIAAGQDAAAAVRDVMATLERMLGIDAAAPSLAEEGGVFALIGATGVGKTTTVAKLASQCASAHGAASVGLLTLDVHRAGAHEQLRAYARSIGLVAHLAHDRAALQELLTLLSGKKIVLIDTAGIAPRDPRRQELLDVLDLPELKQVLVLNAGAHGDTLDDIAVGFKFGGTRQAIVTKVDEAVKLGPVLDTVIRHQLVLRGVANGQRVPQDWKAADAGELVRESMRSAQRSPFDPRTADIDFFFSPAACAA